MNQTKFGLLRSRKLKNKEFCPYYLTGSSRICGERRLDGNQTILVWCVLASREWHIRATATRAGSSGYLCRSPQIRDEPFDFGS